MAKRSRKDLKPKIPPAHDWRTSDADEVQKRRFRAQQESFRISNLSPTHPVFSNFRVESSSGLSYSVEIRDLQARQFACECVDFRINGLGTCKHVEAVLLLLQTRHRKIFKAAMVSGSDRLEVTLDRNADTLRLAANFKEAPKIIQKWFDSEGNLGNGTPETAMEALGKLRATHFPQLRLSQEIEPWLENRRRATERTQSRHEYEIKVQSGEWPPQETTVPLFPYQREGMLHLAFTERALLADEMGLGKTIQAIAACALLGRLGKASRALVVTPASLKTEWEEQIRKFTTLDYQIVYGGRMQRLKYYSQPPGGANHPKVPFFTIVNYEQMVADALDVNARLAPDIVVLDEAQRIKNWSTKTAQAIKRLRSRYAFVLTGTPIENRIDEIHSLMDFLNPAVLGPLFRFNRDFYQLDDRGRPTGFRNLDVLHERIKPLMLRRRKADVETELPERTDRNHFVPMGKLQRESYSAHEQQVLKLVNVARKRPLTELEQDKLQRELAMMRMICDTNYILDQEDRTCPKLEEIQNVIEESVENGAKVIIFSEWERMLELVREVCEKLGVGHAWHTGSVPQIKRRGEINAFKSDPQCLVFLSTDAGATGLNLQNASVVVNCDLPWNPAKLEQRIARAWRKLQTKVVNVINLITEDSIEHRMLATLSLKRTVAASVLDKPGEVTEISLNSGRQAMIERLQQLVIPNAAGSELMQRQSVSGAKRLVPADPALAFAQIASERLQSALVRCEERFPQSGSHSVIVTVVEHNAAEWRELLKNVPRDLFGSGNSDAVSATQFEIIDRQTDECIQRLTGMGLINLTIRAVRPLFPFVEGVEAAKLSPEETLKAKSYHELGVKKLKLARILGDSQFDEEGAKALSEALHAFANAKAVNSRIVEPGGVSDSLVPPLSRIWGGALQVIREFITAPQSQFRSALEVAEQIVGSPGGLASSRGSE